MLIYESMSEYMHLGNDKSTVNSEPASEFYYSDELVDREYDEYDPIGGYHQAGTEQGVRGYHEGDRPLSIAEEYYGYSDEFIAAVEWLSSSISRFKRTDVNRGKGYNSSKDSLLSDNDKTRMIQHWLATDMFKMYPNLTKDEREDIISRFSPDIDRAESEATRTVQPETQPRPYLPSERDSRYDLPDGSGRQYDHMQRASGEYLDKDD